MYSFLCCEFVLSHRVPVPSRSKQRALSGISFPFLVRVHVSSCSLYFPLLALSLKYFFLSKSPRLESRNKKKRKNSHLSPSKKFTHAKARGVYNLQRANGRCEEKEITIRRRAENHDLRRCDVLSVERARFVVVVEEDKQLEY